jgi:hypothetical protein
MCLPAFTSAGTIVGWGDDMWGEVSGIPVGDDFTAVSAGSFFGLALRSDGSLEGWGINWFNVALPPPGNDYIAIAAGGFHALALKQDGSIVAWGNNSSGECTPPNGGGFVAIAAGLGTSFALHSGGWVVAWGRNQNVPAGSYLAIDCDVYTDARLALRSDGSIVQVGSDLTPPPTGGGFIAIAAGHNHGVARRANGSLVVWGGASPPAGNDFIAIAAGSFDAALRADGTLVAWHSGNAHGELDVPSGGGFQALSVGVDFGLALAASSTAPVIRWHPQSCAAIVGDQVNFTVIATGEAPLTYQWRKDGVALSDVGGVSGSTTANLTIFPAQTDQSGAYDVVVTNAYGSATSHSATLTVGPCLAPVITAGPTGGAVLEGGTLALSVSADGIPPLDYQWRKDGQNLSDGGRYAGTTTATSTIHPVQGDDAGSYEVVVGNRCATVTSDPAIITVIPCAAPQIVSPPADQNVNENDAVTLSVTASGVAPLAYQWRKDGANLTDRDGYTGTTTSQLKIAAATPQHVGSYDVVVSTCCGTIASPPVALSVCVQPAVAVSPVDRSVTGGSLFTFSVVVRGSEPLEYIWRKDGLALADNERVAGVSTRVLTIQAVQLADLGAYDVVVTNSCGSATSKTGKLTIRATSSQDTPVSAAAGAPTQTGETAAPQSSASEISVIEASFEPPATAEEDAGKTDVSSPAWWAGGLCGAGALSAMPLTLIGFGGLKARVRSRVRRAGCL